jgi:hypothetical protein
VLRSAYFLGEVLGLPGIEHSDLKINFLGDLLDPPIDTGPLTR